MKIIEHLRGRARVLKSETYALYLAARHPQTPAVAKVIALLTAGYALSPIDLIPDFIPVLGYIDDLILVPAGIAASIRLIPPDIMDECRQRAAADLATGAPKSRMAAVLVIVIWITVGLLITYAFIS